MNECWTKAINGCHRKLFLVVFTIVSAFLVAYAGKGRAAPACEGEVARIVSVQGVIELRRFQEAMWHPVGLDVALCAGDRIRARSHSRAALRLSNDSMLRLDQKTSITFPEIQEAKGNSLLDLLEGAIHIITRTPRPFKIRTPFVNASVEGTEFFVGLEDDSTKVVVYEGKVFVNNDLGSVHLHDHEAAVAFKGQAPHKEIIIRPTDAVQWALYYPAIFDYWQKDAVKNGNSANGFIREAGRLLTVGQAAEAREAVHQALQREPDNSAAHALLGIIALVHNDKDSARELTTKAVALDQQSAAAYLALSYAQQAHFDIETALESVQKALALDAQNALIWARLAELQMSIGHLDRALDAAQHAVMVNPDLAKTQTVLGFAHLLQINTQTAKTVFTQAIALDQADPMPRLGLGLALIREGELEAGRIELEIAASLDPANSLIRSYLGKAYFEEKRYSLASSQFDLAKERDPKDPTPWLYDAIQKQTQNRPVEALRDIQKSIELNDNRAVYRSKFLLDRDEAARGSSLARIFENLGFERRAVMETAKSLSFDPANHSAHRFLSDTYANTPRHEAARVSELLQAQLLQPINVNPVQPHMAVADLNIITNTGPTTPGFNEFAPLMERNKSQVVASGIVGNNSVLGNETVLSKLYQRTSISLGQFHYETNGFRPNNDQNHNIYNVFIQHAFTSKLNLQAEFRTRETQHGDIVLNFNPDFFSQKNSLKFEEDIARIGARYAISPQQDFIVSAMYANRESKSTSQSFGQTPINLQSNSQAYQVEAQYHLRKQPLNLVAGGGIYEIWSDRLSQLEKVDPNCPPTICVKSLNKEQNNNLHLYSNVNLPNSMTATLGVSYNSYRNNSGIEGVDTLHFSEADPKIGLQWDLINNLRLRSAWFETVRPGLIAQQTIEPTQVSGFNQLFDDPIGTRSRRKGIGLDARISKDLYGGIEGSIRQLAVPFLGGEIENQKEQLYRAYIYGLFSTKWSFTSELQFEKFSRNENLIRNGIQPNNIQTLSIPTSLNYFNSNGTFFKLTGTYVRQDLERLSDRFTNPLKDRGEYPLDLKIEGLSNFFLLDAVIGYRLPRRRGLISIEGRNLLNEEFFFRNSQFYVSQPIPPRYAPYRALAVQLTLNF